MICISIEQKLEDIHLRLQRMDASEASKIRGADTRQ